MGVSLSFKDTSIKKSTRVIVGYKYAAHHLNIEASKVPPTEDILKKSSLEHKQSILDYYSVVASL